MGPESGTFQAPAALGRLAAHGEKLGEEDGAQSVRILSMPYTSEMPAIILVAVDEYVVFIMKQLIPLRSLCAEG